MPIPDENTMKERHGSGKIFFIFSLLGSLYLLLEAGLHLFGRSVCVSDGCGLAARTTRFGDLTAILIGFFGLSLLALLSGLNLRRPTKILDSAINLILIAALATEGFFVGYQIFWLPEVCLFCLTVFGIFLFLGILRILAGWKEMVLGFAAFAVVLCFVGLILPPPGTALPSDKKMILFYSEDCRHCIEIKEEIAKNKLDITPMLVKEYTAALKNMGVESVPTLFVNARYEKLILTGKEAIRRYLATCQSSKNSSPAVSGPSPSKKESPLKSGNSGSGSLSLPLGETNPIFNPSNDEGICKENQKCE